MTPGLRTHKSASCRIAIAEGLPVAMQDATRELLDVEAADQGNGHASALMHQVTAEADRAWVTLILVARPFQDGMTQQQLERFYGRFGFAVIQADPVIMMRSPERPRVWH